MTRQQWAKVVWGFTAVWLAVMLLSLHFGWLNAFSYDLAHNRHNLGIDFFQIGRAFHNIVDGRSVYDTFTARAYGPYTTWYVYHPLLAYVLGPLLAPFSPWAAYGVWTFLSVVLMGASAALILQRTRDPLRRAVIALLLLGSWPLYNMLDSGNIQSLLVFALTLVLVAVDQIRTDGPTRRCSLMLAAGLFLSLFSKPAVLILLPLLLLLKETRKTTLEVLGIYAFVSLAFVVVPGLNPEAMTWQQRWELATHPAIVEQTMNVYTNGFTVTPPMKDNSIHWLATMAMADTRLQNVDVYSLPVFLDGLTGTRTAASWYRIPTLLVLEMSLLVLLLKRREDRLNAAFDILMATSLVFFLSFGIVWEYSYTSVLPLAALLLTRARLTRSDWAIITLVGLVWLPSLYLFTSDAATIEASMVVMRLTRVLPVLGIFCILALRATQAVLSGQEVGNSK